MSAATANPGAALRAAPWTFAYWALVGACAGVGVAGALSVGPWFLALAIVLTVVGLLVPTLRGRSALAVVGGLGVVPLWIAWLNRDGPGVVCTTTATMTSCAEQWSPWPFVAVGAALVFGSVLLVRRRPG